MRELRVVGVGADGSQVICQDAESGEKFTIAADERLRAAARGDLSRLGQIEIEMTSTLRPREIQSRIRAGATVAEVAAIAGVGVDKIERFAHPVLLERSRAAELAGQSHPIRHDGPAAATLGEVVAESLVAFAQNPHEVSWDAWKGEDGYWAVQVSWHVGHSEHRAHWRYLPGSHGGTAEPLDDLAEELTHPELIEPRRRLTPVAAPPIAPTVDFDDTGREQVTFDADSLIGEQTTRRDPQRAPFDQFGTYALDFEASPHEARTGDSTRPEVSREPEIVEAEVVEIDHTEIDRTETVETATGNTEPADTAINHTGPDQTGTDHTGAHEAPEPEPEPAPPAPTPVDAPRRRKSRKPAVPAWEDVLLGVRSHPNN
ncbi:septation protein SepH [Gordonia sp. VNQ95]|uniref:septation protein SepH n=1 Tax=Gordonia sp. VNQ95 TaxID=3156619 RepID=UPI0032B30F9E